MRWRIGRLFSIASDGNISRIMEHDPLFVSSLGKAQAYIEYVENSTLAFLRRKVAIPVGQPLQPCNFVNVDFQNAILAYFKDGSLPTPDLSCLTQFEGTAAFSEERPSFSIDDIFEAVVQRGTRVFERRMQITHDILGESNWTSPDVNFRFLYQISRQKCEISHIHGQRIYDNWYLVTAITNTRREASRPLFERQYLQEYMHVDPDGRLGAPLQYSMRRRPDGNGDHIWINTTTTSLLSGRGRTNPTTYTGMYPADNPALISALRKSEKGVQQVEDALAPSSLSILVLPLALNLIPLAMLTNVRTRSLFLYTVLSDVLTVVPLSIKGVELTTIARRQNRAVVTRVSNAINGSKADSAAMLLWVVECKTEGGVRTVGIVFVVVSIVFMLIGVGCHWK